MFVTLPVFSGLIAFSLCALASLSFQIGHIQNIYIARQIPLPLHQGDNFILMTVCLRQPPDSTAINQQITRLPLSSSPYPRDTFLPFKKVTHLPPIKEQRK